MRPRSLTDKDLEDELEKLFGLDNPEESEDEYEEEEFTTADLEHILETPVSNENEDPNIPSTSKNQGNDCFPTPESGTPFTQVPVDVETVQSAIVDDDITSDKDNQPRNQRRRRIPIVESSEESESDESDLDEDEWKKINWTNERPIPERYDDVPLQASVYFPSRTSPLAYFTRFFCDDVLHLITEQTNLYAEQQRSKNWEPVTVMDIKLLLGIIILMGLHDLPSWDLYWSSDPFFRVEEIARVMTCKRFKKIMENLHLNDNAKMPGRNDPQFDKLYKVRPLLEIINVACAREAKSTSSQSIDEAMIKFKGVSSLKQYMPLKPVKRGFKVWVRADSFTGYVYQFDIYTGKNDNNSPEMGLGANVVKLLTTTLIEQNIPVHVTFDNFFASFALMQYLYNQGIHSTATVNANRADLPKLIKNKEKAKSIQKTLQRGQYKWRVKNDVAFVLWKDTKPVTILTTAFHPTLATTCNRTMKDGTNMEIPCPEAVKQYTQRMGGVDRFDQKRANYEVGRKSKKWWRRIFYFVVDLTITNSYLLYQRSLRVPNPMSNLKYRLALARGLIDNASSRKRKIESLPNFALKPKKITPSQNYQKVMGVPNEIRFSNVGSHMPREIETLRRCRLCSTKENNKRSKMMCCTCLVPLCIFPCFSAFHSK